MSLARTGKNKIEIAVQNYLTSFVKENKLSRVVKNKKYFEWENIGVVRSKAINDGTFLSVATSYFRDYCGFTNGRSIAVILAKLDAKSFAKFGSELNTYTKRVLSGLYQERDWIKLVDINTLIGYPKNWQRNYKGDPKEVVERWLVKGEERCELSEDVILKYMNRILGVPIKFGVRSQGYKNFKDYLIARWPWINQGASKYSQLKIEGDKVRTKLGTALSLSDKQLLAAASKTNIYNDGLRAFVKTDEKGPKGRFIVNAPFGMYVRQKYYIDYILNVCVGLSDKLGAYQTSESKYDRISVSLRSNEMHVPIDFDSFDQTISIKYFNAFQKWCDNNLDGDYLYNSKLIHSLLTTIDVFDSEGNNVGKWNKGLPSGLYATAFLGSLFNLVGQMYLEDVSGGKYKSVLAQGDDGDIIAREEPDLNEISHYYKPTGLDVNVTKNWFKPGVTEFLKQVITAGNVYQYPARAFSSLAWAFPSTFKDNSPIEKLTTLASTWKEVYDRFGLVNEQVMIDDIWRAMSSKLNWSKDLIYKWLHTAPALGGFGLVPVLTDSEFKFRGKTLNLKSSGNRFKRFPLPKNMFEKVTITKVNVWDRVNTDNQRMPTIFEVFNTQTPTWAQYIEYTRATSGLTSDLKIKLTRKKQKSDLPFRRFGFSDIYVLGYIGALKYVGFTSDYLTLVNAISKLYYKYDILKPLYYLIK